MTRNKFHELGEALLKRTMHALRVPDEMADAQRRKIFAFVPGSKSSDGATTFVLPNLPTNSKRLILREIDGGIRLRGTCWASPKKTDG
jgi:hypothetical protein